MTETYTIEAADDGAPIDPRQLRELRDLLRGDDDLDLGVRLIDRPPAPGEQGAIPVALEIITTVTPLSTAFAVVLRHWIDKNKKTISLRGKNRQGDDFRLELGGFNSGDAERLIEALGLGSSAESGDGE